jgi:hypothetical protein
MMHEIVHGLLYATLYFACSLPCLTCQAGDIEDVLRDMWVAG